MKKYWVDFYELKEEDEPQENVDVQIMMASEVDEVIMNMVSEFAETAKEYESDHAKDKEEITRLKEWIEWAVGYIEVTHGPQFRIKEAREALTEKEESCAE